MSRMLHTLWGNNSGKCYAWVPTLFKSHYGHFHLFFCSAFCTFFSNTCFLGFFTFFLPLVPTSLPPYLIPSQGLSAHPSIYTFASSRIIVLSPSMSTVSGVSEFLRYVRCSGLHVTPKCAILVHGAQARLE